MNTAVAAQTRKPIQQDLRYQLPRWMVVFVVIALTQELTTIPPTGWGLWTMPALIVIGLVEGAFGGLVFVGLQRWWNPGDRRSGRIRNYLFASIIVGVGSLWAMTAIYS
jgi:H+/Cl- antiporter ClcA